MMRVLHRVAACFAVAAMLMMIHRSALAQNSAETSAEGTGEAAASAADELQAAPPADINDAPALPPPAANNGSAEGPILNRPDRSLLIKSPQKAASSPQPAPQATIRTEQEPLETPALRSPDAADAAVRPQDVQAAALRGGILFGRMTAQGLPIDDLAQDSIFYRSGLRPGDVIVSLGGRPIRSDADFARAAVLTPGKRMPIVVLRNGTQGTLQVDFAPRNTANGAVVDTRPVQPSVYLGVVFDPQVRDLAVIQRVNPGSPAAKAGVQVNDIILGLNGQEVASAVDAVDMIRVMRPGDQLAIVIERARAQRELVATLGTAAKQHTVSRPAMAEPPAAVGTGVGEEPRAVNRAEANENNRRFNRERANGDANERNERNRSNNERRGLRLFRSRD